jgi:chemotaxis protein CheY-P-specific phosphatase CheC
MPRLHAEQTPANSVVIAVEATLPQHGEHNVEDSVTHNADSLRTSMRKWHQSAVHEAMRNIGSDVPDVDTSSSQSEPTEALRTAGVDALDRWSKAHEAFTGSKSEFMMPLAHAKESAVALKEQIMKQPLPDTDEHEAMKELHQSAVHEAMHSIGSNVPDAYADTSHVVMADPEPAPVAEGDNGQGLMESWSKAHSEMSKSSSPLVDMYPPTAAPETDMLALAMARGFGQQASKSLEAPVSKAVHLHEAMQSLAGNSDVKIASEQPSEAVAAAGADILSKWSKVHSA